MSILSEQLIGSNNMVSTSTGEDPFGDASKEGEVLVGFGGYTYAQNPEMQTAFNTTPAADRTGPIVSSEPLTSKGEQYGPLGRTLSDTATTILGQMGEMLKSPTEGGRPGWNTTGGGAKMAHLFATGRSLRSVHDATGVTYVTGTGEDEQQSYVPNASGGPFAGYDANNHYGISNWMAEGGAGSAAVEEVKEVRGQGGHVVLTEGVEGVEASNKEIFRANVTMETGLRVMPPQPAEGGAADTASGAGDDTGQGESDDQSSWR